MALRPRLACAFAQSGFEALQEAAQQQLPSGRRRGDTPAPVPGGIRCVPAGRQWGGGGGDASARGAACTGARAPVSITCLSAWGRRPPPAPLRVSGRPAGTAARAWLRAPPAGTDNEAL